MKVIAELSLIPVGIGTSFSEYIAECERIFNKAGLKTQLHAEGTNIEGDFDQIVKAIKESIITVHKMGAPRVITNVSFNSRTDKEQSMEDKIKSVEKKI